MLGGVQAADWLDHQSVSSLLLNPKNAKLWCVANRPHGVSLGPFRRPGRQCDPMYCGKLMLFVRQQAVGQK